MFHNFGNVNTYGPDKAVYCMCKCSYISYKNPRHLLQMINFWVNNKKELAPHFLLSKHILHSKGALILYNIGLFSQMLQLICTNGFVSVRVYYKKAFIMHTFFPFKAISCFVCVYLPSAPRLRSSSKLLAFSTASEGKTRKQWFKYFYSLKSCLYVSLICSSGMYLSTFMVLNYCT